MGMFVRCALSIGAVMLLSACVAPSSGALLQGAGAQSGAREAGDLLYVGSPGLGEVYVYKYPNGQSAGTLTGLDNPVGLCSDTQGNVWVTNAPANGNSYLLEYAHGGTQPIAKLDDSGFLPLACSIEPTTGNLAVGNSIDDVAVWKRARGKPSYYLTSCCVYAPSTITYDSSGNLIFADFKTRSGWLPKEQSQVKKLSLHPNVRVHGAFYWDGKYLSVFTSSGKPPQPELFRYTFSRGKASQVDTVPLDGTTGVTTNSQFEIEGSTMVLAAYGSGSVYIFDYPKGGKPTKTITGLYEPFGVTVSVAPSR